VGAAEQVQGVSDSLPAALSGEKVITALLRADLRLLPSGAGIAVFKASALVTKVGTIPPKGVYLDLLRVEAERLGGSQPASVVLRAVVNSSGRRTPIVVAAAPITNADGSHGLAVVMLARAGAYTARTGVLRALLISAVIAVALAILLGWGLGAWMARPLRRLTAAAESMAAGSYDHPVSGSYPGEVQELAHSMETMRLEVRKSELSLRGFVASAAHELRTPLTSIQGFSQALLDGTATTPEEQARAAAAIQRESTRLRRLVDALLTLSRYDSHEFEPSMTPLAVDALVREEIERLVQAGLADPGRITLQNDPDANLVGDGDMLRQVVANLLRNAVQYGDDGPVSVRLTRQGRELVLEVANRGEPLAEEDRSHLFTRFYRGRAGRRTEGLGLGLSLVWEICEVLGGRVELVEGGPTIRFRVTLPVAPATPS
jgi:signal transduction histidine kinase